MAEQSKALDAFHRLIAELPEGMAGSVELVANQLSPTAERFLRLGSIPHAVDMDIAKVLLPDVPDDELEAAAEELRPLSFVIRTSDGSMLHDEVRAYLFGQWLDAHANAPDKWGLFKAVNRRLVGYYTKLAEAEVGEAHAIAERQRIFHLIGADRSEGFAAFQKLCRAERYRFRLESCETLIKLMREYEPIFSANQRSWLDYYEAKLEIDLHHYDKAKARLNDMLERDSLRQDPGLHARCIFRLGTTLKQTRDFQRARGHFEELRHFAAKTPEAADLELRALQGLGSLLIEMGESEEAEEVLGETVMLADNVGRHDEIANAWNALGILRRNLNQPKRAQEAFETALKHLDLGGESFRQRQVHNNIGLLHADRAEWPAARESLERSRDIAREAGDMNGEATALSNLGRVYLALELRSEAIDAAERAVELFRNIHNWYGVAMTQRGMARFHRREERRDEARAAFVASKDFFLKAGAGEKAAEVEAEIARLDSSQLAWGWLRWLLTIVGGAVGFVGLLIIIALLIVE